PRALMSASWDTRRPGQIFSLAPLYRLPNVVIGCSKFPKGIPPAKELVERLASPTGAAGTLAGATGPAGVLASGLRESVLLHPTMVKMIAPNAGTRRRAILRDNLKLWVIRGLFLSPSTTGLGVTHWLRQARRQRSARPKRRLNDES